MLIRNIRILNGYMKLYQVSQIFANINIYIYIVYKQLNCKEADYYSLKFLYWALGKCLCMAVVQSVMTFFY